MLIMTQLSGFGAGGIDPALIDVISQPLQDAAAPVSEWIA